MEIFRREKGLPEPEEEKEGQSSGNKTDKSGDQDTLESGNDGSEAGNALESGTEGSEAENAPEGNISDQPRVDVTVTDETAHSTDGGSASISDGEADQKEEQPPAGPTGRFSGGSL